MRPIIVGTRASKLALVQTGEVISQLSARHPECEFVIRTISTGGDNSSEVPLTDLGLGMFVKEIEESLLNGEVDIAVHSMKDLTTELPPGLTIGAVCKREDPRDVLVNRWGLELDRLSAKARIGTSSPRRTAQLKARRPDLKTLPIRGNVNTRIDKAHGEDYDGVMLAAAGVIRLGLDEKISQYLPVEEFVPAPGQGALAVEIRRDNEALANIVRDIDHAPTHKAVTSERAFLERLDGGCQEPSAAYARVSGETIVMIAFMASPDGQQVFTTKARGRASYPHEIAMEAHQQLIEKGAGILASGRYGS